MEASARSPKKILLIMVLLKKMLGNKYFQAILKGLKPCITGIIAAAGFYMIMKNTVSPLLAESADILPLIILVILLVLYYGLRKLLKKKISPIMLIMFSAIVGIVLY